MADWTASSGNIGLRPYRNLLPPRIMEFEESTAAATAVIRKGDVVSFDTLVATGSHRILRAPSSGGDGTNLLQVNVKSIVGVAAEDSTSDGSATGLSSNGLTRPSNRRIRVFLATPDQEFLAHASSMAPASSAANLVLVGRNAPLVYDRAYGRFFVGTANATAALASVQIVEVPEAVLGDSGSYPLVVKFLSTNLSPIVAGSNQ